MEKGGSEDDSEVTPLLASVSRCVPFHLTANIPLQLNRHESQCHPDKITLKAKVFREKGGQLWEPAQWLCHRFNGI